MNVEQIPDDWKPWIEIAKSQQAMKDIMRRKNLTYQQKKLAAVCLSAAKWITGKSSDLGIRESDRCGMCLYTRCVPNLGADAQLGKCIRCHLEFDIAHQCLYWAPRGGAMRLYTELYNEYQRGLK